MFAVRRVTQDQAGNNTPGVDGVAHLSPKARLAMIQTMDLSAKVGPVRRSWIPKPGKPDKRPLGIPTMRDRAKQAVVTMVLEPAGAAVFEPHRYGVRPGRGGWDAIAALPDGLHQTPQWILDADMTGCVDNINHQALRQKLHATPRLHRGSKAWRRAGAIDKDGVHTAEAGTPPGGVLSPLLAHVALHGREPEVQTALLPDLVTWYQDATGKTQTQNAHRSLTDVRDAEDCIFAHHSTAVLEQLRVVVAPWVGRMGRT
jgi:RNA-directed DNA polymerase